MRIWIAAAAVLASLATPAAAAQADPDNPLDRFSLFHRCEPMSLLVEHLHPDADEIGLTETRISTLAESRLRAAGLFVGRQRAPYLYINVNVVGRAFAWSVEYNKVLHDGITGREFSARTWRIGGAGTHGGDASYIMGALSEAVDRFVLEYLRVNEASC